MKPQSQKLLAVMGCVDILMGLRALISVIALRRHATKEQMFKSKTLSPNFHLGISELPLSRHNISRLSADITLWGSSGQ